MDFLKKIFKSKPKVKKADKRGTWNDGIGSLFLAALLALTIRWLLIEAYVIPSGSMLPTLLIHDHIFVNKLVYGVRFPFTERWMVKFKNPERGDVIVFKYPEDPSTFFIKRVVGVPGDKISWDGNQLVVNGEKIKTETHPEGEKLLNLIKEEELRGGKESFQVYQEQLNPSYSHPMMVQKDSIHAQVENQEIPEDSLFVMGDNRDFSNDSRYWGYVPMQNLVGRAMFVWLSCDETFPGVMSFLCNPLTTRVQRFFHNVK
ncbi:MAG: signal peptidase I [Oligoflexia bacterium]|nr:signal peptidase I [Oligoflexia bacterium]